MVLNLVMGDMIFEEYSYEEEDYIANLENPSFIINLLYKIYFYSNYRSILRSRGFRIIKRNRVRSCHIVGENIIRLASYDARNGRNGTNVRNAIITRNELVLRNASNVIKNYIKKKIIYIYKIYIAISQYIK